MIGVDDYNTDATHTSVIVTCIVPDTGFLYVSLHLDYGLKGTTNYAKNALTNTASTSQILIPDPAGYAFSFGDPIIDDTIYSKNVFKKNPGIGGLVSKIDTDEAVQGVLLQAYDSGEKLLGTVYTDEDGWYMWQYKHTGKAADFTVEIPGSGLQQSTTLKSNGFAVLNFELP